MAQGILTADAHTRSKGIDDQPEDMVGTATPIGTSDGLQRERARSYDQLESSVGYLSGNRVFGRRVIFGIESLDRHGFAILEAVFREAIQNALHAFIKHFVGSVLKNRYARNHVTAVASTVPIGYQQNRRSESDEEEAKCKTFDDEGHNTPDFCA